MKHADIVRVNGAFRPYHECCLCGTWTEKELKMGYAICASCGYAPHTMVDPRQVAMASMAVLTMQEV
jgi:hypothetical protein